MNLFYVVLALSIISFGITIYSFIDKRRTTDERLTALSCFLITLSAVFNTWN